MLNKNKMTIFTRIFFPLFAVMLLQSAIFYAFTVHGGVVSALDSNAVDILVERVDNRRNELESRFVSQWTNLDFYVNSMNELYDGYCAANEDPLWTDAEQQRSFLADAASSLVSIIRGNGVNGAFLVLNPTEEVAPLPQGGEALYGLCIRDYDLRSGYTDKEDLLILRCPSAVATKLGCSLDSYWESGYRFNRDRPGNFYYKPALAAAQNPGVSWDNLAYLEGSHTYGGGDRSVISYSLPLVGADGRVYGVLGVELTEDYLSTQLPSEELDGKNNGTYMLVQYQADSSEYRVVAGAGTFGQRCFGGTSAFTRTEQVQTRGSGSQVFGFEGRQKLRAQCCVSPLTIYNRNTPFEGEVLALVGAVQEQSLFAMSRAITRSLIMVMALVLLVGCGGIFVVSHLLALPIKKLAQSVSARKAEDDTSGLEHINIREIDQLVDAIEQQSRKISQSRARTEFFSRMSHDMRTPMNAIIGFSSPEMLEKSSRAQLLDYLDKINSSGRYLLGLINEVLDMTKIDSGHMELENKPFVLHHFWNGTLPMIDELAARKNVHFVRELPEDRTSVLLGDEQRLSQILVNLLSNAVKFTPADGTVTLAAHEQPQKDGVKLEITVRDTGLGMSEEFQKKLYQPFVQEHSSREGTGLGLAISSQLVRLMGGTITCRSALGQGTEFRVELCLPRASQAVAAQSLSGEAKDAARQLQFDILHKKRVLLCEDHPLNRQIASRLLNRQEMVVETAENGEIGLRKFEQSPVGHFDVVLMDIRMPVMDGLQAARSIRALSRPDAAAVPILAMTANAFREDQEASAAAGMNAHLSKPIEPQVLYRTLAEQLEKAAAAQ